MNTSRLLQAVVVSVVAVAGPAQTSRAAWGVRIGGNMSGFGGKDSMMNAKKASLMGPEGAVFASIGLAPVVAVEPELGYRRAGSKYTYDDGTTLTESLQYVQAA